MPPTIDTSHCPPERDETRPSGYLAHLEETARTIGYLRVLFSIVLLAYSVLGPGLLIRFPVYLEGARVSAVARFHGFRPVLYALVFIALVGVLGALARRAWLIYEETITAMEPESRAINTRTLRPGVFPFLLAGNQQVDIAVFIISLVAYGFWAYLLVEAVPVTMSGSQVVGVIMGTYGLLGALIIIIAVWSGLARRARLFNQDNDEKTENTRPGSKAEPGTGVGS